MASYRRAWYTHRPQLRLAMITVLLTTICLGAITLPTSPARAQAEQTSAAPSSAVFNTAPGSYGGLWIGEMTGSGNVRTGPSTSSAVLKTWWAGRRVLLYQGVTDATGALWYRVSEEPERAMYVHSSLVRRVAPVKFEGGRYRGKWINLNLTQQVVTAYNGSTPLRVTLASTGTKKYPTEVGVWKIFYKLPKQDMDGGSKERGDYYYLKDVPYPQYFHKSGEGLHGTYWHDNFGTPMSRGCVNLSTPMAGWFYNWAPIGTTVWSHY